jgi:hypothetical protein
MTVGISLFYSPVLQLGTSSFREAPDGDSDSHFTRESASTFSFSLSPLGKSQHTASTAGPEYNVPSRLSSFRFPLPRSLCLYLCILKTLINEYLYSIVARCLPTDGSKNGIHFPKEQVLHQLLRSGRPTARAPKDIEVAVLEQWTRRFFFAFAHLHLVSSSLSAGQNGIVSSRPDQLEHLDPFGCVPRVPSGHWCFRHTSPEMTWSDTELKQRAFRPRERTRTASTRQNVPSKCVRALSSPQQTS